jgi:hypothetical protein
LGRAENNKANGASESVELFSAYELKSLSS